MRTLASLMLLLSLLGPTGSAGSAEPAAVIPDRFAPVHALLQDLVDRRQIAGAVAMVKERGTFVYRDEVGWQDVASKRPMKRDTLFRMASMTKPVTSVAVMMLVDEGKIALTDPLSKYVPEFAHVAVIDARTGMISPAVPATREITIHDLLTHTSGLAYSFFSLPVHKEAYRQAGIVEGLMESDRTLEENARKLAGCPLVAQPGSSWNYGMSTDMLGRVVEVASGQTLDVFFRERIFEPLGMPDTFFVVPEEKLPRLATLYRPKNVPIFPTAGKETEIKPVTGHDEIAAIPFSAKFQHPGATKYLSGGGGLVSSIDDYTRFLQMLLNGGELDGRRLLQKETVERMTQNQIGDFPIAFPVHGDRFGYGFGVHTAKGDRNGASIGSYSWGGIFHTYFWVDPEREVIGIVLTQLFPFHHLTLWQDYQKQVYRALDAKREPKVSE